MFVVKMSPRQPIGRLRRAAIDRDRRSNRIWSYNGGDGEASVSYRGAARSTSRSCCGGGRCTARDKSAQVDLLFTNVDLKGEIAAGIELAHEAVHRKPNLKVLYTTERSLTDGMKARFVKNSAFLPKPYTVEQLLTTLTVHFRISPQQRRQPVSV